MSYTYPPTAPTISGDVESVNRFLTSPTAVQRRVDVLAALKFLADFLFTGLVELTGGSAIYEVGGAFYTTRDPEIINPGARYPRTTLTSGTAAIATAGKLGEEVPITDEAVGRLKGRAVENGLGQVVNTITRSVDSTFVTAATAAITKTQAATAGWSTSTQTAFLDLELAAASIDAEEQGYSADTALVDGTRYAYLLNALMPALPRESSDGAIVTGKLPMIGNLLIVPTNRLAGTGVNALVVDRKVFGSRGFERIPSPEYTGDPATGIETWVRRDPDANDQWLARGRRPIVPIVQEPNSARKITGA